MNCRNKKEKIHKLSDENIKNLSGGHIIKVFPYVSDMEKHLWKKEVEFVIVDDQTAEVLNYDNDMNVTNAAVNKPLLIDNVTSRTSAENALHGTFEENFCLKNGKYYHKPLLDKLEKDK